MNILITGANGLVGRAVDERLAARHRVVALLRDGASVNGTAGAIVRTKADFENLEHDLLEMHRIEAVLHLAARVHVMRDTVEDPLSAYRRTNVQGTLRVAAAARRAGAQHFVFLSSVKALGECEPGRPWRENDTGTPGDPYGMSKSEAEQALSAYGQESGMRISIVRPPLVYGPGVKANFLALLRALARGVPLPLGCTNAPRSLIFIDNLADLLVRVVTLPATCAAGQAVFHATDNEDLPVAGLCARLGAALGRPARLLPVPVPLLRALGALTERGGAIGRLVRPLRLNTDVTRTTLGWTPPYSVEQGLASTAAWFRAATERR